MTESGWRIRCLLVDSLNFDPQLREELQEACLRGGEMRAERHKRGHCDATRKAWGAVMSLEQCRDVTRRGAVAPQEVFLRVKLGKLVR